MPLEHTVYIRFVGDLAIFIDRGLRGKRYAYRIKGCPSVKDTLEAQGVPHVAIDVILVNGRSRKFSYQLKEGDDIKAYPAGHVVRGPVFHLARPPRKMRFVIDSHLGRLVRHLRLLGFDAVYRRNFPDHEIAELSARERRIVLTRDKGLLKHRQVRWGRWVHSPDPDRQITEVMRAYDLRRQIRPLTLCVECGGAIRPVRKTDIAAQLPPQTKIHYRKFFRCQGCGHVYWRGAHYARLLRFIRRVR